MAASNTDKLRKTFVGGTTLSSSVNASTTTIPLASTNGWPTDTAIDVVIDRVNSDGEATPDKKECITGVVDGTGLLSAIRGIGGVAQSHTSGAIVEASIATAKSHNDMIDALIRTHEQNGDLKENTVGTGQLKENSVTTEKVLDGSIIPSKLDPSIFRDAVIKKGGAIATFSSDEIKEDGIVIGFGNGRKTNSGGDSWIDVSGNGLTDALSIPGLTGIQWTSINAFVIGKAAKGTACSCGLAWTGGSNDNLQTLAVYIPLKSTT